MRILELNEKLALEAKKSKAIGRGLSELQQAILGNHAWKDGIEKVMQDLEIWKKSMMIEMQQGKNRWLVEMQSKEHKYQEVNMQERSRQKDQSEEEMQLRLQDLEERGSKDAEQQDRKLAELEVDRSAKERQVVHLSSEEVASPKLQSGFKTTESGGEPNFVPQKPTTKRRGRPPEQPRADSDSEDAQDKPIPKRRGRPPKKAVYQVVLPSPPPIQKPAAPTMLSLKEKLALKKKSFKVVSKPAWTIGNASGPSSARHTPSTMRQSILNQPAIANLTASNGAGSMAAPALSSSETSAITTPADLYSSKTTSVSTTLPSLPPQRMAPTVFRLISPDSESEGDARPPSNSLASNDFSLDDEDIPAVISPKAVRGTMAVRGRGRPRGRPPGVRLR
ncbi:hypothetical protein IFR05_016500 [Cadophora sp. M221]|nr:hypothetical protein IFR05_016500 [Cadophora sp. M221]